LEIVPDRLPAVLPKPFFPEGSLGYWERVLNKVPLPKVFVLDDLPGHLGIIPDGFPAVSLKCFVLDKLPGHWPIFNKTPVRKLLVLDDLLEHLKFSIGLLSMLSASSWMNWPGIGYLIW
jgi:hypothetical protein